MHLASKCHLLEVVSTVNNMKDVGHLQREVRCGVSVFACGDCGMRACLNCARLEIFFLSIEGSSFNVCSTVVQFTRRTVFNKKKEKDWK